jgi:hypothetical protein
MHRSELPLTVWFSPMFHWTPRRIEALVKLCALALQMQRAAEIRCALPWSRIAHELTALKAIRNDAGGRTISALESRRQPPRDLEEPRCINA